MQPDTLSEDLTDWSSRLVIDSQARLVRNVALTGADSRNGYRYSETALREAAPLYHNKPVFLDHATDRLKPRDRSTRDLVGNIVNPRFEEGRIRGDIHVLDTESGRTFLALASTNLPGVGMSHVVLAQRSADGTIVETIRDVVCVDAVINPATTVTFRESCTSQVAETASSESTAAEEVAVATGASGPLASLPTASAALLEQLAVMEAPALTAERQLEVQKLLQEAQLPPQAVSPLFLQQLEQATTTETRRELLRDRQTLCEQNRTRTPHSWDRASARQESSRSDLIAAIRFRSH